jgi:endonuclease/exonuclease/phosphatase family metal-dependent hydrolase
MLLTKIARRALSLATLGVTLASGQASAGTDDAEPQNLGERSQRMGCQDPGARNPSLIRVMTLNVAHGRSDSINQLLLDKSSVEENVARISQLLLDSGADIVALQEADGPSWWSGGFDHALSMARQADFPFHFRAHHATSWLYRYGTAVLSRLPLGPSHSHRFAASPPTPRKGFVVSEVELRLGDELRTTVSVDILSVHLDFLRPSTQAQQLEELLDVLRDRSNPVIVLGDFNSDWQRDDSPVRRLAEQAGLQAWQPEAVHLDTHEGERIDWILISDHFEFHSYRVLPDIVSDHLPVVAEIGLVPDSEPAFACTV